MFLLTDCEMEMGVFCLIVPVSELTDLDGDAVVSTDMINDQKWSMVEFPQSRVLTVPRGCIVSTLPLSSVGGMTVSWADLEEMSDETLFHAGSMVQLQLPDIYLRNQVRQIVVSNDTHKDLLLAEFTWDMVSVMRRFGITGVNIGPLNTYTSLKIMCRCIDPYAHVSTLAERRSITRNLVDQFPINGSALVDAAAAALKAIADTRVGKHLPLLDVATPDLVNVCLARLIAHYLNRQLDGGLTFHCPTRRPDRDVVCQTNHVYSFQISAVCRTQMSRQAPADRTGYQLEVIYDEQLRLGLMLFGWAQTSAAHLMALPGDYRARASAAFVTGCTEPSRTVQDLATDNDPRAVAFLSDTWAPIQRTEKCKFSCELNKQT